VGFVRFGRPARALMHETRHMRRKREIRGLDPAVVARNPRVAGETWESGAPARLECTKLLVERRNVDVHGVRDRDLHVVHLIPYPAQLTFGPPRGTGTPSAHWGRHGAGRPAAQGAPAPSARAARRRPKCIGARARPARPSSQTGRRRAGWSGAPCRLMGGRRDADLCAWRDRSWPAPARVTTEWPAVRVIARGGGGGPHRAPCLTQRRELGGRVYGLAHQLAQRALLRAAGDRLGEHVFGRLGRRSDGTRNVRPSACRTARIWLQAVESVDPGLQAILHTATA
jgi:hypothetical protein